mmetsp:Transcript_31275/g.57247  ORF Transcript_31275/g.57247 Transcript_31275/m.57247 type:complete len:771 (-) Transcript_31275:154-2466(-)
MHLRIAIVAWATHWLLAAATDGLSLCACLTTSPAGLPTSGSGSAERLVYTSPSSGETYQWPIEYGLGCSAHDDTLAPFCSSASAPAWCRASWCYIDVGSCDARYQKSAFFPDVPDLAFSYETCGDSTVFGVSSPDTAYVRNLLDEAQRYMLASQSELAAATSANISSTDSCPVSSLFCQACPECVSLSAWGGVRVLYNDVGFLLNHGQPAESEATATCLSSMIRGAFAKVAAAEGNPSRVGFQYFADQVTGSYTQMPHTDWCPSTTYDPRRRPWYAAGATAPKDVVIVVDVSGSMRTLTASSMQRSDAAQAATLALLETLNWADYFNMILFSNNAWRFSEVVVQATEANLNLARSWIYEQNWADGSTNYQSAFRSATGTLRNSRDAGSTSTCNRIILFLSDGAPNEWVETDFTTLQSDAQDLGAVVFTYGLSSGADASIIKRIACENKGIYYHIDDDVAAEGLASAMTSYYSYFAAGQKKCGASYLQYTDLISGDELYAACLPFQNAVGEDPPVLGVGCLDFNMLVDMNDLLGADSADEFVCHISAQTKQCLHLDLSECALERLRATSQYAETCDDETMLAASCGCADPSCTDNELFVDELGYYCDSWVGDNCEEGIEDFGYTAAGMAEVFSNCQKSCGLCPYITDEVACSQRECTVQETPATCRACGGIVPGVDLWGRPMHCPGDTYTTTGNGAGGETAEDGESEGDNVVIIIVAIVIGIIAVGVFVGGAAWKSICKKKDAPTPAPIVVATPVTGKPATKAQVVGRVVK